MVFFGYHETVTLIQTMANTGKQAMFVINVQEEEEKCTESQLDILLKIHCGQYVLVKKKKRSTVWNVYREIARPDGSKLKWRYYCLGCKRVMQSTGGTTSNLRIHKCHVRYLKQHGRGSQSPQPQHNQLNSQQGTRERKQTRTFEELYDEQTAQSSEVDEDCEEADFSTVTNHKVSGTYFGCKLHNSFIFIDAKRTPAGNVFQYLGTSIT